MTAPRGTSSLTRDHRLYDAPPTPWVDISYVVGILLGIIVVVLRDNILPARFFYDGERIQGIAQGSAASFGDKSYEVVAGVYRVLGLADNPTLASILGYLLFVAAVSAYTRRGRHQEQSLPHGILLIAVFVLGAIYLGFYSKDVFVVLIALALVWGRGKIRADIQVVVVILLYAAFFRQYWAITAALYVGFRLLNRRVLRLPVLFGASIALAAATAIAIFLVLGVDPDFYRSVVNEYRSDSSDAQSLIRPFVTLPQPIGGVINIELTYFALLIPLPLALTGGVYYLFLFAAISCIWVLYFLSVRRLDLTARNGVAHRPLIYRCIALLGAFLVTQSLFEPDYGSALRHVTPLLPLVLFIILRARSQGRELR